MLDQTYHAVTTPVRILIVDDHPGTASTLARILGQVDASVEILTAHNGPEALALVGDGVVDIIIADYRMPGMNGLELIEKVKSNHQPVHAILITAYDSSRLAATAQVLEVDDYVVKPIQPEKIRALVNRALMNLRQTGVA